MRTYYFDDKNLTKLPFIINDERSGLGFAYPRLFIKTNKGNILVDLTLELSSKMSEEDFNSWLDGKEIVSDHETFSDICRDIGLNPKPLLDFIKNYQNR